ncbi:hypothetical protein [Shewanella algae]|uniref:hypothetical protein n=1 Tax=Shewanella algae TaxID=38313 RepID=UPI001186826F|nr:hypothetical protein [Shewanella algae]MBO2686644.1 hypothetical protein [Shewanella algae]QHD52435.1 hypothetical protein GM320_04245 [Shewanella algae]TVP03009.1 hypothetical protein AYI73_19610 [Shewanella algae]
MDATVGTIIEKFEKISAKKKRVGLLLLAVATFSALLAVFTYLYINRDLSYSHQPILENKELLALAAKSQPNPDIYASSVIKPDNPLFSGLYKLQRLQYQAASSELAAFASSDNSKGMYWYGLASLGLNILSSDAPSMIERSAKLGNPYAMKKLVPTKDEENICHFYLVGFCDRSWADKAQQAFEERVKNNPTDVQARYAASKALDRAAEAARNKYYAPLTDLVVEYMDTHRSNVRTVEENRKLAQLLTLAANNNFVPAMNMLAMRAFVDTIGYSKSIFWAEKAMLLGSDSTSSIYFRNKEMFNKTSDREYLVRALPYAYVANDYFGDDAILRFLKDDVSKIEKPFVKAELFNAKEEAKKIIEKITPVVYIDELFDHRYYNYY